jgi:hyperosmotically inducible protein
MQPPDAVNDAARASIVDAGAPDKHQLTRSAARSSSGWDRFLTLSPRSNKRPARQEFSMKSIRTAALALCTTLALGGVAVTSTAFAADPMPAKSDQPVTDTWITTKVKTELATTDGVKSTKISVTTKDGIVALVGVLATKDAVDKAIAATEAVKGVKRVDSSGLKVK